MNNEECKRRQTNRTVKREESGLERRERSHKGIGSVVSKERTLDKIERGLLGTSIIKR